jgi:hypothetical protein
MAGVVLMAGRDPERIAESLREMTRGRLPLRHEIIEIAADEMDRMREYLLETSGRLHQIATEHGGLSGRDCRKLANDMCRMANRRFDAATSPVHPTQIKGE